jgi:serine/threonine-protein kinase
VTDFGIARAISDGADSRLTATGVAIGTPAYMSPEQCSGDRETDGRSDIYSLGVLGYQMLTGRLPFEANNTPALLVKHLTERPKPVHELMSGVPLDLSRAVMLCLEKEPANRFPSAQSMVAALDSGEVPAGTMDAPTGAGLGANTGARSESRAGMLPPPPNYGANTGAGAQRPTGGGRGLASARSPMPGATRTDAWMAGVDGPSAEDLQRWYAPQVEDFRRKLAPFIAVGVVTTTVNMFGGPNLMFIPAFWSVGIAFKYAKLWSDGYDWRDVLREPRERLFSDVVVGWGDTLRSFFDPVKRSELRERKRHEGMLARPSGGMLTPLSPVGGVGAAQLMATNSLSGERATVVRQAMSDRDEIVRLVESLPKGQRESIGDIPGSARSLADRVQSLAVLLEDLERNHTGGALAALEKEIATLEAAANPLDISGSDDRVRRLAYLKRQRRAVADVSDRRDKTSARLESCRVALQNMRFDVLRLRTGTQSPQSITLVAEEAMALARDVDGMLAAQDVVARGESARRGG